MRTIEERNKLIEDNLSIVKDYIKYNRTVHKCIRYYPGLFEIGDIEQAGYLGLISAAENFDETRNIQFKTYAIFKIRGFIHDFLRQAIGRNKCRVVKKIKCFCNQYISENARKPTLNIIINELNLSQKDVESLSFRTFSIDAPKDMTNKDHNDAHSEIVEIEDLAGNLTSADSFCAKKELQLKMINLLSILSPLKRLVMTLIFFESWKYAEVAKLLNINPSRVSQIVSGSLKYLRNFLNEQDITFQELLPTSNHIGYRRTSYRIYDVPF